MATSTETEIAIIKNDLQQVNDLFIKLDNTLAKVAEVSTSVSQMLAVHEAKINNVDEEVSEIKEIEKSRREEVNNSLADLHSRMSTQGREVKADMTKEVDKIMGAIKELKDMMESKEERVEKRIEDLERWRWYLVGLLTAASILVPTLAHNIIPILQ